MLKLTKHLDNRQSLNVTQIVSLDKNMNLLDKYHAVIMSGNLATQGKASHKDVVRILL